MNQPLFSVLIANYNNRKYLKAAIESVVSQTYPHWEIIIVDDGSTDNSKDVLSRLSTDKSILICYNTENKGCGYTKRRCVELAHGDLCCFLDADDVLLPNALEDHVEAHRTHLDCSCVFSRYYKCAENLSIIEESRMLTLPEGQSYFSLRDYSPEHLTSFKKKHYDLTDGINAEILAAVDQDLYFKLEEVAPIFILDRFTYKYRSTTNQISQGDNWSKALYWNLKVQLDTCKRRNLSPSQVFGDDTYNIIPLILRDLNDTKTELQRIRNSKAYRLGKRILHPFRHNL